MHDKSLRIPDETDLMNFRSECADKSAWKCEYAKADFLVYSKQVESSAFKALKIEYNFKDIPASLLFDVLMDGEYRKIWDKNMIKSSDYCQINPNNDIGYYAIRCFTGIKDRDFVLHRSWLVLDSEYFIFNRSITHKALPPQQKYIRANTYLTAYHIRVRGPDSCDLVYISHCDPRGKLPSWAINKATNYVAPNVCKRLQKACIQYPSWKQANRPTYKPWIFPEQCTVPYINWDDLLESSTDTAPMEETDENQAIDLSA